MFYERTKHTEVDYFTSKIVMSKKVVTSYIKFENSLGGIFNKAFRKESFSY